MMEFRKKITTEAKSLRNMEEILPRKQEEDLSETMQGYLLYYEN